MKTKPSHEPTAQQRMLVETLSGFGVVQDKIAMIVGISLPTLHKHYRDELDIGRDKVESHLIGKLMKLANGDDGTALKAIIFMLTTKFGWTPYGPASHAYDEPPALGKKEQANVDAETAHIGTPWEKLLN